MGLRKIPGFPDYRINEKGNVFSYLTKRYLTGSINPAGYCHFRLKTEDGDTLTVGRHRLLMLAFKYVENHRELYVNHKNGIKGDDWLDNLEWATPQENVEHAGEEGLSSKCKGIIVLNAETREELVFKSIRSAAEHFGVSKDLVGWRLKFPSNVVWPEGFCYKYKNDNTTWAKEELREHDGLRMPVEIRCALTGKIRQFRSLTDFCDEYSVKIPTAHLWLKTDGYAVLPGMIQIRRYTKPRLWWCPDDPYLSYEDTTKQKCVVELENGNINIFTSVASYARSRNIKTTTAWYRINSGSAKEGVVVQLYRVWVASRRNA